MSESSGSNEVSIHERGFNQVKKVEKLTLIPNDLFEVDHEAEQKRPAALEGVPYYKLDALLKGLPLVEKLGEIQKVNGVSSLKDVKVLRIRAGGMDMVLKTAIKIPPDNPDESLSGESNFFKRTVLTQAAGMNVAHSLDPELVDAPTGVFTYKDQPVAFAMPYIEGTPQQIGGAEYVAYPISKDDQRSNDFIMGKLDIPDMTSEELEMKEKRDTYRQRVSKIKSAGIRIDDVDSASNAVVTGTKYIVEETPYIYKPTGEHRIQRVDKLVDIKPGNPRSVKLIDLEVSEADLNKPLVGWSKAS